MSLRRCWMIALTGLVLGLGVKVTSAQELQGPFIVKPFLQLGEAPTPTSLQVCWNAEDTDVEWIVEYRVASDQPWIKAESVEQRRIALEGVRAHRVYRATLKHLLPGLTFRYRINKAGSTVFRAEGMAPKGADQPYRFVVFGDSGANTPEEKAIAYRTFQVKPDFVMITGDIVYSKGRISEYVQNFWHVYNSEEAKPSVGAPLMRSTLFTAAVGNHDVASRDFASAPDSLAYFLYWSQPLNGPPGTEQFPYVNPITGSEASKAAFLQSAGSAYPKMVNFSFDYGNSHWTVLDANPYVDWTNKDLRAWVEADIASAKDATWRFVSFHHPGFNSSKAHFEQQQMRLMAPIFEAGKVDVVFNGHVHNYQRSYPLKFVPDPLADATRGRVSFVPGKWTLDKAFDGRVKTQPEGVIYLITGAGGNHLYNPEQEDAPETYQEFTQKFISKIHSLSVVDVVGTTLTVRQLAEDGKEIDKFNIIK